MTPTNCLHTERLGKLVLFDIDGTLFGEDYGLNVEEDLLIEAFDAATSRGLVVGLNSDSPYETLRGRHNKWMLNGPLIVERGARIVHPSTNESEFVSHANARDFRTVRNRFVERLKERGDVIVRFGQARDLPRIVSGASLDSRVVIMNPYRECSLSFWVRLGQRQHEPSSIEPYLTEYVTDLETLLQEEFAEIWRDRDRPLDVNRAYGICVAHLVTTTKTAAVRRLTDTWGTIYMVGNSISDWIDDPRVFHCAVANASDDFKAIVKSTGGKIASRELTSGAMELLNWISAQSESVANSD